MALGLFREAVEAARKANSIKCWKEVRAVATCDLRTNEGNVMAAGYLCRRLLSPLRLHPHSLFYSVFAQVSAACIRAGEFALARTAGLAIIVSPDHLEELLSFYEGAGHWEGAL